MNRLTYEQFANQMNEEKKGEGKKKLLPFVSVSDSVWEDINRRLDENKEPVFTGRKDGTNRPIKRLPNGKIVSIDPIDFLETGGVYKEIIPYSWMERFAENKMVPLSKFGQLAMKDRGQKPLFEYNEKGKFIGAAGLSPSELHKRPDIQSSTCGNCSKPGKLKCGRCKTLFYCDVECQKSDWSRHKTFCKFLSNFQK